MDDGEKIFGTGTGEKNEVWTEYPRGIFFFCARDTVYEALVSVLWGGSHGS